MDQEKIQAFREQQAQDAETGKQDQQHQEVVGSLHNLMLATMVSKDPKMVEVAENLGRLLEQISSASDQFNNSSLHLLPMANHNLAGSISELASRIEQYSPHDLAPYFVALNQNLARVASVKPVVNVPKQPVSVNLDPLIAELGAIKKEVAKSKIDIPESDFSDVIKELKGVQKAISSQSFPVPNYVLPFKDVNGKATQVQLDASGNLPISGGGGGGDATAANQVTGNSSLSSIDTKTPALGQTTKSGSTPVTLASDQGALAVTGTFYQATQPVSGTVSVSLGATPTLANVASSATSVTLLALNTSRKKVVIYNDSTQDLYIKYGTTASNSSFTWYLPSLGTLEEENYTGRIDGIWVSANGNARVTEVV